MFRQRLIFTIFLYFQNQHHRHQSSAHQDPGGDSDVFSERAGQIGVGGQVGVGERLPAESPGHGVHPSHQRPHGRSHRLRQAHTASCQNQGADVNQAANSEDSSRNKNRKHLQRTRAEPGRPGAARGLIHPHSGGRRRLMKRYPILRTHPFEMAPGAARLRARSPGTESNGVARVDQKRDDNNTSAVRRRARPIRPGLAPPPSLFVPAAQHRTTEHHVHHHTSSSTPAGLAAAGGQ